jgi:preprotein translocase subunit SecY
MSLRKKILFTFAMILVFRFGVHVLVPGIDASAMQDLLGGQLFGFLDIVSGGAFKRFSIFAMSITPYINASIILNLLTIVIPRLEELSKEGEEGKKKIAEYTRYTTVLFAMIQAIGLTYALSRYHALLAPGALAYITIPIFLTTGTIVLMWLGEMITEKGIGNGISLIIFSGIVARVPSTLASLFVGFREGTVSILNLLSLIVVAMVVILAIVCVNEGQRRIPIQYAKRMVGRRMYGGQSSFLPLKVNTAGVIPIIFAMSVVMFPSIVGSWMDPTNAYNTFLSHYFHSGSVIYNALYAFLIVFFTYFYVAIIFNPSDIAENIKKNAGFIPGIRPGRPTAEFIDRVLSRLTMAGGVFLALIALLPNIVLALTRIPNLGFGGTALLIVVGVALDTMKQIESNMLLRNYEGFVK